MLQPEVALAVCVTEIRDAAFVFYSLLYSTRPVSHAVKYVLSVAPKVCLYL